MSNWDVNQTIDSASFGMGLHCEAQRTRFVLCVNFCAGLSNEELKAPNDSAAGLWNTAVERGEMLKELRAEIDALKASLRGASAMLDQALVANRNLQSELAAVTADLAQADADKATWMPVNLLARLAKAEKAVEWVRTDSGHSPNCRIILRPFMHEKCNCGLTALLEELKENKV